MHYNQSCAAKGKSYGNPARAGFIRSKQKAAVNIFKIENSYEMLVFAAGRIKEHFHLGVNGNELSVFYSHLKASPVRIEYCGNTAAVGLQEPLH